MSDRTVFVLGAGFTRAFVPNAPLLVDDFDIASLRSRFNSFPHARAVLDRALAETGDGRVDLERLMTRLSGMPYDDDDARRELGLLDSTLRKSVVRRLEDAKAAGVDRDSLGAFARFVLAEKSSVVTFNYDDVLDQALWEVYRVTSIHDVRPYWHPDGGYGFFCRPSSACIADSLVVMDRPRSLMLKLHGSINWRPRLGETTPRGPAGLVHHEKWFPPPPGIDHVADRIEAHMEPEPFIVPPVLVKSELTTHPVLRVVWELAHHALVSAKTIVFIGYSLPQTDLAARALFAETLTRSPRPDVSVVNLAGDRAAEQRVKDAYRALVPDLLDAQFDLGGARNWIERQVGRAPAVAELGDASSN